MLCPSFMHPDNTELILGVCQNHNSRPFFPPLEMTRMSNLQDVVLLDSGHDAKATEHYKSSCTYNYSEEARPIK
jgi:hypothetical protein